MMFKQSKMADHLVTFNLDNLDIGLHLGSGSFASVYSFSTKSSTTSSLKRELSSSSFGDLTVVTDGTTSSSSGADDTSTTDAALQSESESMAQAVANNDGLALKTLHKKVLKCPLKFRTAVRDMQNEVTVLSSLPRHPNIITLYGTSEDFGTSQNTFIVLERLNESLETALGRWKLESKQHQNVLRRRLHWTRASQNTRLQNAAIGAARALHFLHSRNIIYRDLKPQNLGMDRFGNIRLFDFGLATPVTTGTDLLERVGTLRYMAPEVASRQPYHLSADVYSFGMVLYEIVTLSKPFKNSLYKAELECMVTDPESAPTLQKVASPSLRELLHECRSYDRRKGRPTMSQVLSRLQQEVGPSSSSQSSPSQQQQQQN